MANVEINEVAGGEIPSGTLASGDLLEIQDISAAGASKAKYSTVKEIRATGWGNYQDQQYTSGSPFSVSADTDTILPNDSGSSIETQLPNDVSSFVTVVDRGTSGLAYDHSKINGKNGDGIAFTIDFKCTPTNQNTTYLEMWVNIGGSIGELFRQSFSFPKGAGVTRNIAATTAAYTLDTWETNGATVYINANGPCTVYDIRFLIHRTHKAL